MIKNNKTSLYFNAAEMEAINAYIGEKPINSFKELILQCISQPTPNGVPTEEYAKLKADFDKLEEENKALHKGCQSYEDERQASIGDSHKLNETIKKQGKRIAELESQLAKVETPVNTEKKAVPTLMRPVKENSFILPVNFL